MQTKLKAHFARLKPRLIKLCRFLFNWHFVLCFGIAWMITNGWSYVCFAWGSILHIRWLKHIAAAYMALLWLPFTPEKIITAAISILLLKLIFPGDQKTLAVLTDIGHKAKSSFKAYISRKKLEHHPEAAAQAPADEAGAKTEQPPEQGE